MMNYGLCGSSLVILFNSYLNPYIFMPIETDGSIILYAINNDIKIRKLYLEPNCFILLEKEKKIVLLNDLSSKRNVQGSILSRVCIDPEIFQTLINNNLITYSMMAAQMYQLPVEYASDYQQFKNKINYLTMRKE